MVGGPRDRARATARSLLGRSYALSKRVALARMARRRDAPVVVFSMGKTGSTAVARAVQDALERPVYQVFRLDASRLREAEARYRARPIATTARAESGVAFPGAYHLWESEYLVRHPPTPGKPWSVITTVREPVAQAVSAYFHALRQSGGLETSPTVAALTERFVAEKWVRAPLRWFEREFNRPVGVDALAAPFDPGAGYAVVETPAVRLLLLRQESFDRAPGVLASFLGLPAPVAVPRRNDGASGAFAGAYRRFLDEARLPPGLLDEAYDSPYAHHFYDTAEIAQFRRQWSPE
jgi:hypothetical protein